MIPVCRRHPRDLGAAEVTAYLSRLAADGVSASTQNGALSAILFMYEVVIGQRLPWMHDIVRAQRPVRVPVVLYCSFATVRAARTG